MITYLEKNFFFFVTFWFCTFGHLLQYITTVLTKVIAVIYKQGTLSQSSLTVEEMSVIETKLLFSEVKEVGTLT